MLATTCWRCGGRRRRCWRRCWGWRRWCRGWRRWWRRWRRCLMLPEPSPLATWGSRGAEDFSTTVTLAPTCTFTPAHNNDLFASYAAERKVGRIVHRSQWNISPPMTGWCNACNLCVSIPSHVQIALNICTHAVRIYCGFRRTMRLHVCGEVEELLLVADATIFSNIILPDALAFAAGIVRHRGAHSFSEVQSPIIRRQSNSICSSHGLEQDSFAICSAKPHSTGRASPILATQEHKARLGKGEVIRHTLFPHPIIAAENLQSPRIQAELDDLALPDVRQVHKLACLRPLHAVVNCARLSDSSPCWPTLLNQADHIPPNVVACTRVVVCSPEMSRVHDASGVH